MASKANLKTSGREAALARRRALSAGGKPSVRGAKGERTRTGGNKPEPAQVDTPIRPRRQAALEVRSAAAPSQPQPQLGAEPVRDNRSQARASRSSAPVSHRRAPAPAQSAARARREALSRQGRRAMKGKDRVRGAETSRFAAPAASEPAVTKKPEQPPAAPAQAMSLSSARSRTTGASRAPRRDNGLGAKPTGRMLSLARRAAQSGRGKAATNAPTSAAGLARQANPTLSGRELAQRVRSQRSTSGGAGERKSAPTGRLRPNSATRGAQDQPWKVGASETVAGQVVTGTRVGRSVKTTGDEPSTCRTVTGTEYMGADIFREFCQTEPQRGVPKVGVSPTGLGNRVTGNEVGRSPRVTGDEPGSCKLVTGTDYLSPAHYEAFCETRPQATARRTGMSSTQGGQPLSGTQVGRSVKVTGDEQGAEVKTTGTQYTNVQSISEGIPARQGGGRHSSPARETQVPAKVGLSSTLAGRQVTGTLVGRSAHVTGDEPGSCRAVTGDEYLSSEQFERFCDARPEPEPAKVGESRTALGQRVSGTQTGRSVRVTGDEPGTCKAVTGTPYAGLEQAVQYCSPEAQAAARERMMPMARRSAAARMTGQAPGVGGKVSGDGRGACEPLTGTPYVGADQRAVACADDQNQAQSSGAPGLAAAPDDPDFPRPLTGAPWQEFSVSSPARQADHRRAARTGAVTGTKSEGGGHITGPFGMATGKITGTEEFRFGSGSSGRGPAAVKALSAEGEGAKASAGHRITGEGQSSGLKITGDDWDRGERVTGTEGAWAKRRNPTRPGPMTAMPVVERKRNEETAPPVSRVTGSSGNTERGSLITYSGGARG